MTTTTERPHADVTATRRRRPRRWMYGVSAVLVAWLGAQADRRVEVRQRHHVPRGRIGHVQRTAQRCRAGLHGPAGVRHHGLGARVEMDQHTFGLEPFEWRRWIKRHLEDVDDAHAKQSADQLAVVFADERPDAPAAVVDRAVAGPRPRRAPRPRPDDPGGGAVTASLAERGAATGPATRGSWSAWTRFWFTPIPAARLGLLRIWLFGFVFFDVLLRKEVSVAMGDTPRLFWHPVGATWLLDQVGVGPPDGWQIRARPGRAAARRGRRVHRLALPLRRTDRRRACTCTGSASGSHGAR